MPLPIGKTITFPLRTVSTVDSPYTLRAPDTTPTATMRRQGLTSGFSGVPTVSAAISTGRYNITFFFDPTEWQDAYAYDLEASYTMEGVAVVAPIASGIVEELPFLSGSVSSATSGEAFAASGLGSHPTGAFVGQILAFRSGANAGHAAIVTAFTTTTGAIAFGSGKGVPTTPTVGDRFIIIGRTP